MSDFKTFAFEQTVALTEDDRLMLKECVASEMAVVTADLDDEVNGLPDDETESRISALADRRGHLSQLLWLLCGEKGKVIGFQVRTEATS